MSAPVTPFMGDGAYDCTGVYTKIHEHHPEAMVVIPPRADAVLSDTAGPERQRRRRYTAPAQRNRHIQEISEKGRLVWQAASRYNQCTLVEAQIGRFKQVIGGALHSYTDATQAIEIAIAVDVLNRMLDLGRPEYIRIA